MTKTLKRFKYEIKLDCLHYQYFEGDRKQVAVWIDQMCRFATIDLNRFQATIIEDLK